MLGVTHGALRLPESVAHLTREDIHKQLDSVRRHFDGRVPSEYPMHATSSTPRGSNWDAEQKRLVRADDPALPDAEAKPANGDLLANGRAPFD